MGRIENGVFPSIRRVFQPVVHYFRDISRGYTDYDLAFVRRVLVDNLVTEPDRRYHSFYRERTVESEEGNKHPAAYPGPIGVMMGPSVLSYDPSGEVRRAIEIEKTRLNRLTTEELDIEVHETAQKLARTFHIKLDTLGF